MTHAYGNAPTGVMDPPQVRLPEPDHFLRRAQRLDELAARVAPLGEFLAFMARLTHAQQATLEQHRPAWSPGPDAFTLALALAHGMPPLGVAALQRDVDYHGELDALLAALEPAIDAPQRPLLATLRRLPRAEVDALAGELLAGGAGPAAQRGLMPLVAAALQVAWVRLALALPEPPARPTAEARSLCPCCGSSPVGSVIESDPSCSGVRYLQCGLCATRWYLERSVCSLCDQSGKLGYLSLEDEAGKPPFAVQAETCGDCDSYLKIVPRELDAGADPVADDLASLALDLLLGEEGRYRRSGFNPLLIVDG